MDLYVLIVVAMLMSQNIFGETDFDDIKAKILSKLNAMGQDGVVDTEEMFHDFEKTGLKLPKHEQDLNVLSKGQSDIPPKALDSESLERLYDSIEEIQMLQPPCGPNGRYLDPNKSFMENFQAIQEDCAPVFKDLSKKIKEHPITDMYVRDTENILRPLVDIVMEGGGTLGIALAGFTWSLEETGIRFRSVAGTSAGAIVAAFLASSGEVHEPRSKKALIPLQDNFVEAFIENFPSSKGEKSKFRDLLSKLLKLNCLKHFMLYLFDTYDGIVGGETSAEKALDIIAHMSLDKVFSRDKIILPKLLQENGQTIITLVQVLEENLGLFNSTGFKIWFTNHLHRIENSCHTLADLENAERCLHLDEKKVVFERDNKSESPSESYRKYLLHPEVALITTDVTTRSRAIFPRHAPAYFKEYTKVEVGTFVQASMSVPFFFTPMRVSDIPHYNPHKQQSVKELVEKYPEDLALRAWAGWPGSLNYDGYVPKQVRARPTKSSLLILYSQNIYYN